MLEPKGFHGGGKCNWLFMLIEDDQILGFDRLAPRVLVDMDLLDGLPDELEVQWDGGSFS